MIFLILGVLLWSFLHLAPAVPMQIRDRMISAIGEKAYKGLAGMLILASIVLMVLGWKALPREFIYELPAWADVVCGLAMLLMSILFFATYMETNIKRFLRHPQLVGIVLMSLGHVLASGQVRSLVLFGGIGAWAILEMLLINRRDGVWVKPAPVSFKSDFKLLVAGLLFFLLFIFVHDGVFGASLLPDGA